MQQNDAARRCEEQFRRMTEAAPMMVCTSGPDRLATYFNKAWLSFTGKRLEQELGYGWTEGLHTDDRQRVLAAHSACVLARGDRHLEYRLRRADGEYRWITSSGAPWWLDDGAFAGYLDCCIDMTELRQARDQAFDQQKIESMRVLAGGIAHDLCNLLAVIQVQAEEIETEFAGGASPVPAICRLRSVAACAAEIVRELMIYSEEDQATLEPVNVSHLIDEMFALLVVSISKRATLQTDLGTNLPPVLANKTQMRQMIMNLVINASEAIAVDQGIIRITTAKAASGGPVNGDSRDANEGYVRIEVADTGDGMTDEVRSRIFERSFTTKAGARGMGLVVVRGIVHAHAGSVEVSSAPGRGTTFEILLPSTAQEAGHGLWTSPASSRSLFSTSAPTILLVEKEDHLRVTIVTTLRKTGFSVLSAPDDEVALDLLRNHLMDLDAVILDLTPGRSGLEVLKQVRQIRGRVPVILTGSGTQVESPIGPGLSFLPKPYRIDRLVKQLRRVIHPKPNRYDGRTEIASSITCVGEHRVNSETMARAAASSLKEQ